jgi:uncharacterized protein (DUF1330 family)
MAAYVISEIEPRDPVLFERYRALAPAAIARHGGRYLVRGGASEVVEGGPPARMIVILEFPSMTQVKAWYGSADYAEARAISRKALKRRLIFIEGVAPA